MPPGTAAASRVRVLIPCRELVDGGSFDQDRYEVSDAVAVEPLVAAGADGREVVLVVFGETWLETRGPG